MKVLFVVDPLMGLDASIDTSVGLMHAVQDLGGEAWVTEASQLELRGDAPWAWARQVLLAPSERGPGHTWSVPDPWFKAGEPCWLPLEEVRVVFMRTEPPVDLAYTAATFVLDHVDRGRTALVNDPRGLRACSEHLLGTHFPDVVPQTLVTAHPGSILDFVRTHGRSVVKPVDGFSGRGVFLLDPGDLNLGSLVETTTDRGGRLVVVQRYLPEVEQGNTRIVLLDGEPIGAVLRHPVPGDFRIAHPDGEAVLTARDHHLIERLRPLLRAHGLRLACLDVIGDHLIEVNVTSAGALRKIDGLLGTGLCRAVVEHVLSVPLWSEVSS